MSKTTIQWTEHSVNPIRFRNLETGKVGHHCVKCSPGCKNCYASKMQKPHLSGLPYVAENTSKGKFFLDEKALYSVLRRSKPTIYFWCDMTDMFGEWVPDEWIHSCFGTMALTSWHTHQVLTKRSDRMELYCLELYCPQWKLPNVWLGVSVEDRERRSRIEHLRSTPAAVRFLSLEPLLEDLGRLDLRGIDWVIVGGESGPGARPCHLEWIRSIVEQCAAAGVACFVKQAGARTVAWEWADRKGGDPAEWPEWMRVRQMPEVGRRT